MVWFSLVLQNCRATSPVSTLRDRVELSRFSSSCSSPSRATSTISGAKDLGKRPSVLQRTFLVEEFLFSTFEYQAPNSPPCVLLHHPEGCAVDS